MSENRNITKENMIFSFVQVRYFCINVSVLYNITLNVIKVLIHAYYFLLHACAHVL